MRRKKILFVVHRMNVGGVQKSLLTLLDTLDYSLFDVTLFVLEDKTELIGQVPSGVARVVVNRDAARYYRRPKAVLFSLPAKIPGKTGAAFREKLKAFVFSEKLKTAANAHQDCLGPFDAAVAYKQGAPAAFVAKYVQTENRIMVFHGSTDEDHALHEKILPAFHAIVAVNEACRAILRALYPQASDRMTTIENCVDAQAILKAAAEYAVDRMGKKYVLCTCGRMTRVKGFDLALEAAAVLNKNEVDFIWYFVGDGPERTALQAEAEKLGLADRIRFTGMLSNPYPCIAAADVYVQPSREESYGLTIREATVLGRPVVSTRTVGGEALLLRGECGILTSIEGSALAVGILKLLADPVLLKRISEAAGTYDPEIDRTRFLSQWKDLLLRGGGEE